ncbi:MAG: ATP-binding protein [Butyrivibrio sp.]|nr:ATP-binding protein [Muribaculum sp.]MCM1551766.1 ATP-binding protein [Butyrivibrio sp.]
MRKKATNSKKHTIFRMFLVPLIAIMLVQSLLVLGTLFFKQTFERIQDYSIDMMTRIVENRKVILENALIQRCTAVCAEESAVEDLLSEYLRENQLTLKQMMASDEKKREFLTMLLPECLNNLQGIQSTGIFVILTGEDMTSAADYEGFFVRDSDPKVSTTNNTDLLFERGSKELSRTFGVPLDNAWTTYFHMAGQGQRAADDFFYEPWRAGVQHPDAQTVNLGYWSEPFILEDNNNDSHEMITYSVPLRYKGKVYGVFGIEISSRFLYDYFPTSELNDNERSGYLLAIGQENESYMTLMGKGVLYNSIIADETFFELKDTDYDTLYEVEHIHLGTQNVYAVKSPLKLYDSFAPYENVDWVLVGLDTEDGLFGMSHQLYMWMGIAILAGLVFGVFGIYVIILHLTKPIKNLTQCINEGSAGLKNFQATNILEIDGVYDVIQDLMARQKESESILREEKERYRVAIESTSDMFFTFEFETLMLDIVNHPTLNGTWKCGESLFRRDIVYYEDWVAIEDILSNASDKIYKEIRIKFPGQEDFLWYGLYGQVVYDAEGNRSKVVGGMRNIQALKEQEARRKSKLERDSVTGFYAYDTGVERLEKSRAAQPKGIMLHMLLEKLGELNEKNGIVFGDMILEELAHVIRKCCQKLTEKNASQVIAIRFSGDEFVIWFENHQRDEAELFMHEFFERLHGMFDEDVLRLQVRAGLATATEDISNTKLIRMAKLAQNLAKDNAEGCWGFYEDIASKHDKNLPKLHSRRPISNDYGDDVNLASLALNLFGKGENLQAQVTLILRKIGYQYGATDALITIIRPDFRSNYLEHQWHSDTKPLTEIVNQYTDKELEEFLDWLGEESVRSVTVKDSKKAMLQKFLNISEGQHGLILPMFDNGSYMGNIAILGTDAGLSRNSEELQKLAEVRSVIQSQINQQQHDLASKAKSDFLSRMSHEIRTPMNGIIGMTAIALQKDQSKERMLDCLNKVQDSSKYLLGLINDILDMSKIESGKMHLEEEDFDLREMLDTVGELVRPQAEAKQIRFIQKVELKHMWYVADQMRISQVLINLLGNAVKFTNNKGEIVLTVQERGTEENGLIRVYFAVRDNGVGISKEDQKRVFRSFEQARDASSVSKQQGTGLGLSISSRLVQMMGSVIDLESEPGEGSCFSFEIALQQGHEESEGAKEEEDFSFENYHVLVVEDNELNVEVAQCLLEEYGFSVDCVFDGQQAVDRIKSTPPGTYDVILMDIMMPVMNGLDATRAIRAMDREDCRTLPIIAMSANAFDDDLKKSVECGMNGHLSKPVEVDKLYKLLREILQKK